MASDPRTPPTPRDDRKPTVTCIVPAYNEAEGLPALVAALDGVLRGCAARHDLIVVDDGSRDATSDVAAMLAASYPVRLLQLSRNFGKEAALTAGLDHADGDVVVMIDADLQHPPELIPVFIERWRAGYDMVYGTRGDRTAEPWLRRMFSKAFYGLMTMSASVEIPPDAGDFRLLDRRVVLALRSLSERTRFMKGLYAWVGFRTAAVPIPARPRTTGTSRFRIGGLFRLAFDGLFSFSDVPLRVWTVVGAVISATAMLYGAWVMFRTLLYGIEVPGWATLTVSIMFLGGIQLLSVGILGEYVARIFNEVKRRPPYIVARRVGFPEHEASR